MRCPAISNIPALKSPRQSGILSLISL